MFGEWHDAFESVPLVDDKPSVVISHTVKVKSIDFAEHDPTRHHKSGIAADLIKDVRASLDRLTDAYGLLQEFSRETASDSIALKSFSATE